MLLLTKYIEVVFFYKILYTRDVSICRINPFHFWELFFFEVLRNDSIFQVLFCSSYIKINFRIAESVPSVLQNSAD